MTLPSTGIISHDMIRNEMGGENPIQLSEYYGAAVGLPVTGQIANSDFYGVNKIFHTIITIGKITNAAFAVRKGFGLADKTSFLHPEAGQSFAAFGAASVTKYVLGGFDLYGIHAGLGTPYTTSKWVVITGSNPVGRSGAWDYVRGRKVGETEWITIHRESSFTGYGGNSRGSGYILFTVKDPNLNDPVSRFHSLLWHTPVGQQIEVEFV